ncbi:hypothetical protein GF406_23000 [candidate division KSB1 bacterium]|nr:hypothetical protein [candidate division KSB1 bacterium]
MGKQSRHPSLCAAGMNRRRFISTCGSCAALCAAMPVTGLNCSKPAEKKTLRILYSLHAVVQPRPDWPNVGFDFEPVMQHFNSSLQQAFPSFTFLPTMATGEEEAKKILTDDSAKDIDGYIVFQMNCWNRVIQTMATSGKPVLYVDFAYGGSGGFLVYNGRMIQEGLKNVGFVSSSNIEDLIGAVECFGKINSADEFAAATTQVRIKNTPQAGDLSSEPDPLSLVSARECLSRLKTSKILAIKSQESGPAESIMHIPMEWVAFSEVNAAWEKADRDESRAIAEKWQQAAQQVIDVPMDVLESSAAFYLGMKEVLKAHEANAITINCLGGFYGGHIHAYPCLGFHELCNEGLIGACECDTRSTATMVAFTTMTQGRPGYISDPVMDTARRQIIYAHCVASNKVFGPQGLENPYLIMTHSEDRQGASLRSIMPVGYLTTTLEIQPDRQEIIMHQAKAVDNDPNDRACRTKLCAEPVGDMEKLFKYWGQWGWHRVTFYGDLKEPVYDFADLIGWKVIEEA